jgi:hypothetical protein
LVNLTVSPTTAVPATGTVVVTVVDAVAVVAPSAGTLVGLNVTTEAAYVPAGAGLVVWSMVAEPLPPVLASVAVTVQKPLVVLEM